MENTESEASGIAGNKVPKLPETSSRVSPLSRCFIKEICQFENLAENFRVVEIFRANPTQPTVIPEWSKLDHESRQIITVLSLQDCQYSSARAITVKLGEDEVRAAYKSKKGPLDYIKRRFDKILEKNFKNIPEYTFTIECHKKDKSDLHLHGTIFINIIDENSLKNSLLSLTSYGVGNNSRPRAIHIKEIEPNSSHIWASYCVKSYQRMKKSTGRSPTTTTENLSAIAADFWGAVRRQLLQV